MSPVSTVFAAVEWGGKWQMPPVGELFNFDPFPGTEALWPFAINRTVVFLLLATVLIGLFFLVAFSDAKIVPGRLQAAAEALVEFIRERIAIDIIGPEGVRYVPFLTCLFLFIFLNNLFKITPFIMFPPTSRIAIPALLAVLVWFTFVGVGILKQGPVKYLKEIAFPPGVPWPAYVLITPIEIVSNILLRPFTLAIRLFANMVAGHILVVITLITIHAFLALRPGLPIGVFALAASPVVFGFEFFIISLQAYIFTMLSAVYIGSSLHPEH